MGNEEFLSLGKEIDTIDIRISHRIIQLFSEGLYSSPNKAVEELVSNSFDAYAKNVHVILPPNFTDLDAKIVVIDDGEGMGVEALKKHWIVGRSTRRIQNSHPDRKPIGKFGIGKLATYVLAEKLTHVCKTGGKYFVTTMNYTDALTSPPDMETSEVSQEGIFDDKRITIPIHELSNWYLDKRADRI